MTSIAIHLHGAARRKFGGPFSLSIRTPEEALRALMKLVPGFRDFIGGSDWKVIKGPIGHAVKQGRDLDAEMLGMLMGSKRELHLVPVVAGAKRGGMGKIIAGVAILALSVVTAGAAGAFAAGAAGMAATVGGATAAAAGSFAITYANIAMIGVSLILGGLSQRFAPSPRISDPKQREDSSQKTQNGHFNGPVNLGELGQAIPITISGPIHGVLVGSVVGSAGLSTEQL
ncbi:hypothetical protein [Dongia sp.]|uniref:hypothetical protein n=1 Tax=Dongia sp. TaxID=1977262 RepID=UPI0035AED8F5